jgi:hypothetical protein
MVDDLLRQPGCFELNTTIKFYLFALFIALIGFGGTSFILRDRQLTTAAPAKLTIAPQADASREEKRQRTGLTKISLRGRICGT